MDDATATTALYLVISTLRQFARAEQSLRAGNWKHNLPPAHDPSEKTLAILGLGGIGLRLAELCRPFNMRVLYHSRNPNPRAPNWCEYVPADRINEMYAQADILSIHVPLRKDTEGFVNERVIRALKPGAILINTARGKVIDEAAMIRALEDGHVSSSFQSCSSSPPLELSPHSPLLSLLLPILSRNKETNSISEPLAFLHTRIPYRASFNIGVCV